MSCVSDDPFDSDEPEDEQFVQGVDGINDDRRLAYVGVRHRSCSALGCSALVAPGIAFCSKHVSMAHDMNVEIPSNQADDLDEKENLRQVLAHAEYRLLSTMLVDVRPLIDAPADRLSTDARQAVWTYHTRMTGASCPACMVVSTWIAARLAAGATEKTLDIYSDRGKFRCPACDRELVPEPLHPFPRFRWICT